MSDIQRYEPWPQEWPMEDANGDLVTYEDHRKIVEAAEAQIAALTAKIEELRGMRRDDALELLAAHGQAQEAYAAQIAAEAEAAALRAERDEALESVTNNNDWFGMHCTLWVWLITQPDMPQLDDLEDGGADEVARNYERAITALVDARTAALRAKVARLEGVLRKIADMLDYRLPRPQDVARAALNDGDKEKA